MIESPQLRAARAARETSQDRSRALQSRRDAQAANRKRKAKRFVYLCALVFLIIPAAFIWLAGYGQGYLDGHAGRPVVTQQESNDGQ